MSKEGEAILERLLTGSLDPSAPEVLRYFQVRPAVAERWEHLRGFESELASIASDQRETLAQAMGSAEAPVEAPLGALVVDWLARNHPAPAAAQEERGPIRLWGSLAAFAAAAALLLFLLNRSLGPSQGEFGPKGYRDQGPMLGAGSLKLWPNGIVDSFDEFRWSSAVAAGGESYRVFVYDPGDPDGEAIASSPDLSIASWNPSTEAIAKWPHVIYWELVLSRDGRIEDVFSSSAELRSP